MSELGLIGQFLGVLFAVAVYPLKALVHTRQRMKRTRQVRNMLYGPTDTDDGSNGKE